MFAEAVVGIDEYIVISLTIMGKPSWFEAGLEELLDQVIVEQILREIFNQLLPSL
jgi:hypothetical protein